MTRKSKTERKPANRRIVGFSLSPELAATVKVEAARRGVSLRKLFEEMWSLYQQHQPRNARDDGR